MVTCPLLIPVGGLVLLIFGAWLTGRGFVQMPLSAAHIAGWLATVFGGVLFGLWAIPFLAEKIPTP